MNYGRFHTLRCKDEIAAALLDDADDRGEPASPTPDRKTDADPRAAAAPRSDAIRDPNETPVFPATTDEGEADDDVTVLTGPAGDGADRGTSDR
jgi:hypothetical protein